jgi:quercetin dioxygenase-like cupin family protein
MNSKMLLSVLCLAAVVAAFAAGDSPTPGIIHLPQSTVDRAFSTGGPILTTNNFKVLAGRRTAAGEVEIHDHDTDIFYILEGSATFVTGGKAVDTRSSGAGESRAKSIVGGHEQRLSKGEIIVIPNGIPHWFKEVDGTFLYYMVKVTK